MTNEMQYRNEINYSNDYKVNIVDFMDWLYKNEAIDHVFTATIKKFVRTGFTVNDLYNVAVDYSIPIILIKWFVVKGRKYWV